MKKQPMEIVSEAIQTLPELSSWPQILFALRTAWAQTTTARTLTRAEEVFGDRDSAVAWLTSSYTVLGGIFPVEADKEDFLATLSRIQFGDIS